MKASVKVHQIRAECGPAFLNPVSDCHEGGPVSSVGFWTNHYGQDCALYASLDGNVVLFMVGDGEEFKGQARRYNTPALIWEKKNVAAAEGEA